MNNSTLLSRRNFLAGSAGCALSFSASKTFSAQSLNDSPRAESLQQKLRHDPLQPQYHLIQQVVGKWHCIICICRIGQEVPSRVARLS